MSTESVHRETVHEIGVTVAETELTAKRKEILDFIAEQQSRRGFPPSVREIGEAVGLTSSSTVHAHLATLQRLGYLQRDPTKPRAIEVRYDPESGASASRRPARHVPLVGDVAAGVNVLAQENIEDLVPLPEDFTGTGSVFMLRVRGDSMIDAGIPGEEATVKRFSKKSGKVVLTPANARLEPMVFDSAEVQIFGKVVSVLRRL